MGIETDKMMKCYKVDILKPINKEQNGNNRLE